MKTRCMIRILILGAMALSLAGCVTTHVGEEKTAAGGAMALSCAFFHPVGSDYFRQYICTVENKSRDWQTVEVESIKLLPDNAKIVLSTPEDIRDFSAAYQLKAAQYDHNTRMALGALIAGGTAAMVGANHSVASRAAGRAGASVAAAAILGEAGHEISADYKQAQYDPLRFGHDHILGGSFRVAPGLFVRKGLLIQLKEEDLHMPDAIEVCLKEPTKECVVLNVSLPEGRHIEAPGFP